MDYAERITIPSEPIGSIPRPDELITAQRCHRYGKIGGEHLNDFYTRAVQLTIGQFAVTGSRVITDGEQTKPSFLTYPIAKLLDENYSFSQDCFALKSADGHHQLLPRLVKAPFRFSTYAYTYIDAAKRFTKLPIKQTIISPSALTMLYPVASIRNYSHTQFLDDVLKEAEKDIRWCLEKGAHSVQMDFIEASFALKIDPSGELLRDFVRFNNRVLSPFVFKEQHRLGVHICLGVNKDCDHSSQSDYAQILPFLFDLHVGNFYLPFPCEHNREEVFMCIRKHIHPWNRIFIGVIDPFDPRVETPAEVCDRILEAAKYISVEQLGTTDNCGFSPFADDRSVSRQVAFDKIRARIKGTYLAEEQLMLKKNKNLT